MAVPSQKKETRVVNPYLFNETTKRYEAWNGSVSIDALASVSSFQKTVTTAGTAEQLASTSTIKSIAIKALASNTGIIYVGNSGVDSTNGYELEAGEGITLLIDDPSDIYIDSSVNGEGVSCLTLV